MRRLRPLLAGAAILALLAGCDTIFTTSPLSWARRDPDSKSLEQRVNDAKDALASGKRSEIADAYDAIKDDVAGDGDLELLAAQLTLALSGINDTFDELSSIDFTDPFPQTQGYINGVVAALNAAYVHESAVLYGDALADGGDLTATDYIMGAMAMLADAAITAGGGDIGSLSSAEVAAPLALLTTAQAALAPDDPSYTVISQFAAFLGDPSNFP
jgi:hypothetical protein